MIDDPWELLGSEPLLDTKWLRVLRNRYRERGREIDDYYVIERSPFVLVVAIDPDDQVLLVRQYRPATEEFYLALPAGYLGPGETPVQAGAREMLEETGVTGERWADLGHLDPLPGYIRSRAHVVRCAVPPLDAAALAGRGDADEANTVMVMGRAELRRRIAANELREMQLVAGFLLAEAAEPVGAADVAEAAGLADVAEAAGLADVAEAAEPPGGPGAA
jgi:ADP-ribose pyrophosphatase